MMVAAMVQRKYKFVAVALALCTGIFATGCVGLHNALSVPVERTTIVELDSWPKNAKPIRIALLSDIHVGNLVMRPERLRSIVDAVNAARPDIVLLAGDFVIGERREGTATRARDLAPLAGLHPPGGVFAVLGNHDHWTDAGAIQARLTHAGVRVLENDAVRRGAITIVGIGDRFSGHDDIARSWQRAASLGGIAVAFTHSPDVVPDLPKTMPVLFAGHTHCGQVVAPWIGPIGRYSRWHRLYDPKYRCGRVDEPGRVTIVTGGVGSGTLPMRFNAMPDWWLIELRARAPRASNTPTDT
ncbi:metallophosphoesterase [Sphingomonas echinoides]|uniref:Metallophosphoesterase n=2 Tax=Sphingomonas echinoides TaxID=59803 RepID=A0ABU4PNA3_9SPHN|nr:metallophosphoesterase [Sphingomonas echinoides]MDX5984284.1 metallophosphoesterase [Sphingomonas echinoides]